MRHSTFDVEVEFVVAAFGGVLPTIILQIYTLNHMMITWQQFFSSISVERNWVYWVELIVLWYIHLLLHFIFGDKRLREQFVLTVCRMAFVFVIVVGCGQFQLIPLTIPILLRQHFLQFAWMHLLNLPVVLGV